MFVSIQYTYITIHIIRSILYIVYTPNWLKSLCISILILGLRPKNIVQNTTKLLNPFEIVYASLKKPHVPLYSIYNILSFGLSKVDINNIIINNY